MNQRVIGTMKPHMHVRKQVTIIDDGIFIAEPQPLPQRGGFNQPLLDCCESDESPNAVNIDENHDQLESNSASANAGGESSSLPAMGPCDLGALRTSFQSGALSNQDKYKVLMQFDQPQGYKFPAISEGGQLRRFQASWFVNYPWLAYLKMVGTVGVAWHLHHQYVQGGNLVPWWNHH